MKIIKKNAGAGWQLFSKTLAGKELIYHSCLSLRVFFSKCR